MVIKFMMNESKKTCNRCKGKLVFTDDEIVCGKCGVVVDDRIADNSRDYDADGSSNMNSGGRTGPPVNQMFKDSLSSVISQTGKDVNGKRIQGETRSMVNRIIIWDKRGKTSGAKTRNMANSEITRISEVLFIPEQIKQRGGEIFRQCEELKMLRGRTTTVFSAACLYAACREKGLSKTLTDFTEVCFTRRQDLSAYYRLIINGRAGKDPIGLAAAALYHVAQTKNLEHTQRVLSMAAGITEVTIRNRINDMRKEIYSEEELKNG